MWPFKKHELRDEQPCDRASMYEMDSVWKEIHQIEAELAELRGRTSIGRQFGDIDLALVRLDTRLTKALAELETKVDYVAQRTVGRLPQARDINQLGADTDVDPRSIPDEAYGRRRVPDPQIASNPGRDPLKPFTRKRAPKRTKKL